MRYVLAQIEATFGAGATWDSTTIPASVVKNVTSVDVVPIANTIIEDVLGNRPAFAIAAGSQAVRGRLEALYESGHKGLLFESVLGSYDSTTGIYSLGSKPKSLAMVVYDDGNGISKKLAGIIPSRLSWSVESDGVVRWTLDVIGVSESDYTVPTDATTGDPIHPTSFTATPEAFHQITVKYGATVIDARSFELNIDNAVDERAFKLGSRTLRDIVVGNPNITARVEGFSAPDTQITDMLASPPNSVTVTVTGPSTTITLTGIVTGVTRDLRGMDPLRGGWEIRVTSIEVQ